MDRGTWWATVHGVTKGSDTTKQLNNNKNGNLLLHHLKNYQIVFQSSCTTLHSPQQCMRIPVSLHTPQYLLLSEILAIAILVSVKCYLTVVWVCISLMANYVSIFSCAQWAFVCLLWTTISVRLTIFQNGLLIFY